jgi:type IV pilus assembly protein PilM
MEFIGIQKEKDFYRLAYLSAVRGEVAVQCLEKEQNPPEIKKNIFTVTGIEGQDLLIRRITSPLKKKTALQKTLPFQLEPLIPYPLDDVVVKPLFYIGEELTEAYFFCVPKESLEKHLQGFQNSGIDPDWVSTLPTALCRFAAFAASKEPTLIVFHIGSKKIQLVSIQNHKLFSHVTLHIGAEDLTVGDSAKIVEKLQREVDRALCFMAHKEETSGSRKVLFCGEKIKEVQALLQQKDPLIESIEIEGHRGFSGESVRPYAIPIGLAIDALKNDPLSIQLRQEEYISRRSLTKIKKGLIKGGVLATSLFIMVWIFACVVYTKKENALIREVDLLISYYQPSIAPLRRIKEENLESILINLNKQLRIPKSEDCLYQTPPCVTDLLAFISTHPRLEGINVKGVDFSLTHYPTIKSLMQPYRSKVHLVFSTDNAKKARAFHDAIIDDDHFIDKEGGIEWKRNENEYEMVFFLRT